MAIDVFCDESGRGGGNLFDGQPWFVLAAHDYSDAQAAAILPPLHQASEWKWSALRRNFHLATTTLSNPALTRERISVFVAEKGYMAWLKLYEDLHGDALNTPVLTRLPHANHLWSIIGDHAAMPDVLDAYVRAVRTQDQAALVGLDAALRRLAKAPSRGAQGPTNQSKARRLVKERAAVAPVLDSMRTHIPLLDLGYQSSNAEKGANLDPHIAGLGVVFDKWAPPGTPHWVHEQAGPPWVRVHHDRLDAMPAVYVDFYRRLPGIESFDFLESHLSPAIQLADLLAGAVATAANPRPPTRPEAVPLWQWLRAEAIDARFIWELIAHPRHHARYPMVRT